MGCTVVTGLGPTGTEKAGGLAVSALPVVGSGGTGATGACPDTGVKAGG